MHSTEPESPQPQSDGQESQPAAAESAESAESKMGGSPQAGSVDALRKRVEELEAQLKEKDAKCLYLYADFENYKKRQVRERAELVKFGWENVARELLEVLDNLERALSHTPPGTDKNLVHGLEIVIQQFRSTLKKQGVEEVQATGKPFDPHFEEAVAHEASNDPDGTVIQEHSKGYTLHGRLLRPARVVVSSGKSSA